MKQSENPTIAGGSASSIWEADDERCMPDILPYGT